MNPIMIFGMVLVGVSVFASIVAVSDDQSTQTNAANKISEIQHDRVVEAASLKAIANADGTITIDNLANIDAEIIEIRVLDDNGKIKSREVVTEPIDKSRKISLTVDPEIKKEIDKIRTK